MLKYKFWPNTEAVIDTHVMLIVAIDTTCMSGALTSVLPILGLTALLRGLITLCSQQPQSCAIFTPLHAASKWHRHLCLLQL